jgi:small subunit ribosomal protein S1
VEEGLEGLIHISELSPGNPSDPHSILQDGDRVSVEVLNIDGARRRMGLRLEQIHTGEGKQKTSGADDEGSLHEEQSG